MLLFIEINRKYLLPKSLVRERKENRKILHFQIFTNTDTSKLKINKVGNSHRCLSIRDHKMIQLVYDISSESHLESILRVGGEGKEEAI
jgi:hypothetical protein